MPSQPTTSRTINISLPADLVMEVDSAAKSEYASRSDYIRQALVGKLKADKRERDDWNLLEAMSDEIAESARQSGYITDQDFVRAVKEVRRSHLDKLKDS